MRYTFLKKKTVYFRKLFFLVTILIFSYCANKVENNGININNVEDKIEDAYKEAEFKDNYKPLINVIHFIDENNLRFENPCITVKIQIFRSLESFIIGGDYTKMYDFANSALLASKTCSNNDLKVTIYNIIGLYYLESDDFVKAEENYQMSISFNKENTNNPVIVDSYYNLVDIQIITGKWQQALETSTKAISILNEIKGKQNRLKYFYIYKAKAHTYLKKYDLAEKSLNDALNLPIVKEGKMVQNEIDKFYSQVYAVNTLLNEKKGDYKIAYKYSKLEDSLFSKQLWNNNKVSKDLLIIKNKLTNKLNLSNQKIINRQKIILFGAIAFLIFTLAYLYRIFTIQKKLKISLKEEGNLNEKLVKNFKELDKAHKKSSLRKAEIEALLKFNEQSLFTKTLKISNYKDAVNNIIININKLIESSESVKTTKLHSVNRALQNIISEEEFWVDFKIEFEKNRVDFFNKLLERNPDLSISDQKHCAYVAINLKSKEVANILNLSPRSVETTRYRIKKKLNLEKQTLQNFLKEL